MQREPVTIIFVFLAAALGGLTQAPVPAPWNYVVGALALGAAAVVARQSVFSPASARQLASTAVKLAGEEPKA